MKSIIDRLQVFNEGTVVMEIPRGTLFMWTPETGKLNLQPGAKPEHLQELAETGHIDSVKSISIGEKCKKMTHFPNLPKVVINSLEELYVSTPKMENLEGIYKLSALNILHLRLGSKVSTLPTGIKELKNLETLHISGTRLNALPTDFGKLSKLKHLKIADSPITNLPEDIDKTPLESIELSRLKKLKVLPNSLGNVTTIRTIKLDFVPVKKMPEGIYTLPKLESLVVQDSKLSKLANTINWPNLKELNLHACYKKWPKDFFAPKLEDVYIGGSFTDVPDNLFQKKIDRLIINAPLENIDPQWASIRLLGGQCTQKALDKLSESERKALANRFKVL